jgi:hypothetical protein
MLRYNSYKPTSRETEFVGNLIDITPNDISYKFFSDININIINTRIIDEIKQITLSRYNKQIEIEPQQKTLLLTIMRHIYLKNIKNRHEADVEVEILNDITLKEMIPVIMNGLLSQIRYIHDYNTFRPMELPQAPEKKTQNLKGFSSLFEF